MQQMTVKDALTRLNDLHSRMKENNLTDDEQTEFNNLSAALDKVELPSTRKSNPWVGNYTRNKFTTSVPTGHEFKEPNGNIIRAFKQHEPFLRDTKIENGELGEMVKAILIGSDHTPKGFTQIRNAHGSDSSGLSYAIPSYISQRLWDLARAKSVSQSAGVQTVAVQGGNLSFIRTLSDVTPTWRGLASNAWHDVNVTNPTFDSVTLNLKSVAALVACSLEMLEDNSNINQWLEQVMAGAVSTAMDEAVLVGAGTNAPVGIIHALGINETTSVGSLTDYSEHVNAIGSVLNANYQGEISALTWVTHPKVRTALQNLVSTGDDQYIVPPPWLQEVKKLTTTTLVEASDSPDTYYSIVGDFSHVMLGIRPSGVSFELLSMGNAVDDGGNTYNAVTGLGKFLRIWTRMDVAVIRPTHLSVLSGIAA